MLALLTALSLTAAPAPTRNVYVGVSLSQAEASFWNVSEWRFADAP